MNPTLRIAIDAAIEGAKEIMSVYNHFDGQVEYKEDSSPLTEADKRSHNAIVKVLSSTNIPVLSEEGRDIAYDERKKWDYFWLIDPLDGTKEFIKRNDEFTVNIALIHNHLPEMGVVVLPVKNELYFANVPISQASYLSLENLVMPPDDLLAQAVRLPVTESRPYRIVGSRSHMNEETENFISVIRQEYPDAEIISAGSSLKICMVAHGKADIYPRFGPTMEWDTAAGHAIVLGAGKTIVKTDGTPLVYNKENLLNPYFIVR
jgi:3'(2'), 5'-bisphosphate nucleotidase